MDGCFHYSCLDLFLCDQTIFYHYTALFFNLSSILYFIGLVILSSCLCLFLSLDPQPSEFALLVDEPSATPLTLEMLMQHLDRRFNQLEL